MKKIIAIVFIVLTIASISKAVTPPNDLVQKLTKTIHKHCPEALIKVDEHAFIAKYATMMYTLHSQSKTGEVYPQTYKKEGPNFKGFILRVALYEGEYGGAAEVPQTLQGPYFRTFIDAPPTDKGNKHYQIHFSYGSRLNPELKKAIFEIVPKSRFQQSTPVARIR